VTLGTLSLLTGGGQKGFWDFAGRQKLFGKKRTRSSMGGGETVVEEMAQHLREYPGLPMGCFGKTIVKTKGKKAHC